MVGAPDGGGAVAPTAPQAHSPAHPRRRQRLLQPGSGSLSAREQDPPHIARIERRRTPGLDARTTRHASYRVSQRHRKRIEEIFGWLKTIAGMRKSRFVGLERTQLYAY